MFVIFLLVLSLLKTIIRTSEIVTNYALLAETVTVTSRPMSQCLNVISNRLYLTAAMLLMSVCLFTHQSINQHKQIQASLSLTAQPAYLYELISVQLLLCTDTQVCTALILHPSSPLLITAHLPLSINDI